MRPDQHLDIGSKIRSDVSAFSGAANSAVTGSAIQRVGEGYNYGSCQLVVGTGAATGTPSTSVWRARSKIARTVRRIGTMSPARRSHRLRLRMGDRRSISSHAVAIHTFAPSSPQYSLEGLRRRFLWFASSSWLEIANRGVLFRTA